MTLTVMVMVAFERRWLHDILSSFAPEVGSPLLPHKVDADYVGTFEGLRGRARFVVRVGFRLAVWLVALAPYWLMRGTRSFRELKLDERRALLARLLEHRSYPLREAAFLMKLAACLALFADEEVRARSGYDGPLVPLRTSKSPP